MNIKIPFSLLASCLLTGQLLASPDSQPTSQPAAESQPAQEEPEQSSEQTAPAAEEKIFNRLKWSTASELNNFGYNIYRSTSRNGEFEQINEEPLLGAGTTDEVSQYEYHDEEIEPGKEYFYYIESLSMDGIKKRFSPIIKAPPKGIQEPEESKTSEETHPAEEAVDDAEPATQPADTVNEDGEGRE